MPAFDIDPNQVKSQSEAIDYLREHLPRAYTSLAQSAEDVAQRYSAMLNVDQNHSNRIVQAAEEFSSGKVRSSQASYAILEYGGPDWTDACRTEYDRFMESKSVLLTTLRLACQSLNDFAQSMNRAVYDIESEAINPIMSTQ